MTACWHPEYKDNKVTWKPLLATGTPMFELLFRYKSKEWRHLSTVVSLCRLPSVNGNPVDCHLQLLRGNGDASFRTAGVESWLQVFGCPMLLGHSSSFVQSSSGLSNVSNVSILVLTIYRINSNIAVDYLLKVFDSVFFIFLFFFIYFLR